MAATNPADAMTIVCIVIFGILALAFGIVYAMHIAKIQIRPDIQLAISKSGVSFDNDKSLLAEGGELGSEVVDERSAMEKICEISNAISEGATSFLYAEYGYMAVFVILFGVLVFFTLGIGHSWVAGIFTTIAFVVGALTSIASGFIGMKIAVFSNSRTCVGAVTSLHDAFTTAFKAGCVMGFALTGLGLLMLFMIVLIFRAYFTTANPQLDQDTVRVLYECVAGFGLGGSSIALFGRVGGGIYTKAADVGADLVGKVEQNIPEDDPRNPAVIADNVGDNVGDVAGMGADLFGSFAESNCAAMVIASQGSLYNNFSALTFPLTVTSFGILACFLTSFVATHLKRTDSVKDIEPSLKRQLLVSTIIMTPLHLVCVYSFLPPTFTVSGMVVQNWQIFFCLATGLWLGLLVGYTTEYYTSHSYSPVREVADSCKTGAATNIIYGLALGYKSAIIPVAALCVTIYISYSIASMYGIALAAVGILSTMCTGLAIDCYGPISDNAGGIAEMAGLGSGVRDRTDALDAAGNTTAAIGKGFAIGSAALVSLALFGGFVEISHMSSVDILKPFQFAGLLYGAMLPYWFSAMTMKSVGQAALAMVEEVRRQFATIPGLMEGRGRPDYARCVKISTESSLREMIAPGALVMLTPIAVGFLFGPECLAGVLAGTLVSGVQMAISSSNTGGAWDNAKKYIESGAYGEGNGKGSAIHKAAVVGDTVGDPLKDTSGPSLNILIKLMAIISLVFAPSLPRKGFLVQMFSK